MYNIFTIFLHSRIPFSKDWTAYKLVMYTPSVRTGYPFIGNINHHESFGFPHLSSPVLRTKSSARIPYENCSTPLEKLLRHRPSVAAAMLGSWDTPRTDTPEIKVATLLCLLKLTAGL